MHSEGSATCVGAVACPCPFMGSCLSVPGALGVGTEHNIMVQKKYTIKYQGCAVTDKPCFHRKPGANEGPSSPPRRGTRKGPPRPPICGGTISLQVRNPPFYPCGSLRNDMTIWLNASL